jgi:uncharacterized protein with HEPN domain
MQGRQLDYIDHMRQAARDACQFVEEMDEAAFFVDRRTQRAVVMSIVIVGKAATKLMNEHADFVAQHPELPWRAMRGMRNRITHGYFDVDLQVVWQTTQTALPALILMLDRLPSP